MPENQQQNYQNHKRFEPVIIGAALGAMAIFLLTFLNMLLGWWILGVLVALGTPVVLLAAILRIRTYATLVQTRVVRLEMWLRMRELLPEDLYKRAKAELSPGQLAALRFAGDGELEELTNAALSDNLGGDDIKKRVKDWQADHFRV